MATLQGKTVVVVGGTSGIGFAVALAALQSLAGTVIVASSDAERVANAVKRLHTHELPGEVRGEVVNAKDAIALKAFAERIGAVDHVAWTSGDVAWGLSGGDVSDPEIQKCIYFMRPLSDASINTSFSSRIRCAILGTVHSSAKHQVQARGIVDSHFG